MTNISFFLIHPPAADADIRAMIESVRQEAIVLGFDVGELILLDDPLAIVTHEFGGRFLIGERIVPVLPQLAFCFGASLLDGDPLEFGLARYPNDDEMDGKMVSFDCACWSWHGNVRTEDARLVLSLFHFAVELGIEAILRHDGRTVAYWQDENKQVRIEVDMPSDP